MANRSVGALVTAAIYNEDTFDIGDLKWTAKRSTPSTGWLNCDGPALSRVTYASLFAAICASLGTVTVTLASPGVFTLTAHGLVVGDQVYLTTTGALPTGLAQNTLYYVVVVPNANTFQLSATRGGSAINTSGSQSGVHTLRSCPYGLGDGSTTFNLPDARSRSLYSAGGTGAHADVGAAGQTDGTALANARPKHRHTVNSTNLSNIWYITGGVSGSTTGTTGASHNITLTVGLDPVNDPLDTAPYLVVGTLQIKYA